MYTGERPRFGQMVVVDGRLRHWSPELEPPPAAPGLGGFFGDLGSTIKGLTIKRAVKYVGVAHQVVLAPVLPKNLQKKIFGLSDKESNVANTAQNVSRATFLAASAAVAIKTAMAAKAAAAQKAAAAKAAAEKAAFAKSATVGQIGPVSGKLSLMPVAGTTSPLTTASATIGGKTAIATTAQSTAAAVVTKTAGMSTLTKLGLTIGGVSLATKMLGKKPIPGAEQVQTGMELSGVPMGPMPTIGDAWDFGKDIADKIKDYVSPPAPVAGVPYGGPLEQPGQAPQEAGANWLLIAAAVGVGVFMLGGGSKK